MGVFTSTKQFRLGLNLINPWWLSGASIDLDLDNGRYYDSSLSALKQPLAVVTDYLSCSRASTGYAKTAAGTLTQFGNNVLRLTDLGLLVEGARTNLIPQSEDFSFTALWTAQAVTVTADQAVAPNATTAMDLFNEGTLAARHIVSQQISSPPLTANTNYSFSVFIKDVDRRYVQLENQGNATAGAIYCYADLQTGTISDSGVSVAGTGTTFTSATIEAFTNGIYRVTLTGIVNSADTGIYFIVALSDRATQTGSFDGGNPSYTGTSKSLYAWGAQVEQASFGSSYIPTTTTSATRAADNITITGSAQTLIAVGTASIVAQVNSEGAAGAAANLVDSNGTNLLGFDSSNHGLASITATLATSNTANRTSRDKVGLAWSGAGRSLVLNGGTVATDASAQTPSSTQHLGSSGSANFINGVYERLTVWNSKLADATLQTLTAP